MLSLASLPHLPSSNSQLANSLHTSRRKLKPLEGHIRPLEPKLPQWLHLRARLLPPLQQTKGCPSPPVVREPGLFAVRSFSCPSFSSVFASSMESLLLAYTHALLSPILGKNNRTDLLPDSLSRPPLTPMTPVKRAICVHPWAQAAGFSTAERWKQPEGLAGKTR